MATSGSYSYNLNTVQIITQACTKINLVKAGEVLKTDMYNDALLNLNLMIKLWEVDGLHLWKRRIGYCFTVNGTHDYQLGSVTGSADCTNILVNTLTSA